MNQAEITPDICPAVSAALKKAEETGGPAGALVLPDGRVITGKTTPLMGAAAALLLNALKALAGIDDGLKLISPDIIEPICNLKTQNLKHKNPRLHSDETLMALSITSATSETAARVLSGLEQLRGCDAFFSVIISPTDETVLRKLGINVCCEPKFERHGFFHR